MVYAMLNKKTYTCILYYDTVLNSLMKISKQEAAKVIGISENAIDHLCGRYNETMISSEDYQRLIFHFVDFNANELYKTGYDIFFNLSLSDTLAIPFFEKAAGNGHVGAIDKLAEAYLHGFVVEKDIDKGLEYLQKGLDADSSWVNYCYGLLLYEGRILNKDLATAYKSLKIAADNDYARAISKLADMYDEGAYVGKDQKKAFELYQKAFAFGDKNAAADIGRLYFLGDGAPQDYRKAFEYLQIASEYGSAWATGALAHMYDDGLYVCKDQRKAFNLYAIAAEKGIVNSMLCVGNAYYFGCGVQKDLAKAFAYYKKASDCGDPIATVNLGALYMNGEYVPRDYHQAFRLLLRGAQQGCDNGYYNLGLMYEHGAGVKRDINKACALYGAAVNLEYEDAKERLSHTSPSNTSQSEIIRWGQDIVEDLLKYKVENFLSDLVSYAVDQIHDEEGSVISEVIGVTVAKAFISAF